MTKNKHKAFSLIELSIVILIIGVIIAAVTSSSTLLRKMRQNTAASLTASSPVTSTSDLAAWFESTSKESFLTTESSRNKTISIWKDINSQSVNRRNATQATTNNMPTYLIDNISGLPMVYFDGTNDGLDLPDSTIPSDDNSYMVFFVIKPFSNGSFDKTIISSETNENVNFNITRLRVNEELTSVSSGNPDTIEVIGSTYVPYDAGLSVISIGYSNGYSKTSEKTRIFNSEINGANVANQTVNNALTAPSVNQTIGYRKSYDNALGDPFYGYIGEIIIFDRYLDVEERDAITKYLGQKWKVTVTSNTD